jgi:hypothetical protein
MLRRLVLGAFFGDRYLFDARFRGPGVTGVTPTVCWVGFVQ